MPEEKNSARLVVDLGTKASEDLSWLIENGEVNKTTITNRAIQVYRLLMEEQEKGSKITVESSDGIMSRLHLIY